MMHICLEIKASAVLMRNLTREMLWGHPMWFAPFWLSLIYFLGPVDGQPQLQCPARDRQTLLNFKGAIPNFNPTLNWTEDGNCCTWQGVLCRIYPFNSSEASFIRLAEQNESLALQSVQVFSLNLSNLDLRASLPPFLAQLVHLEYLNLSGNHFSGSIPPEYSSFTKLQVLDLSSNNLSSGFFAFENMLSLQIINASSNMFSEQLPSFKNLTNLQQFYASQNSLTGFFDTTICQHSPKLSVLDFASNLLRGPLREGLSQCTHLEKLCFGWNSLNGPLPNDIFNISSLSVLGLQSNAFNGQLDDAIGNLQNLTELFLFDNQLDGPLPKALSQNSKLTTLVLDNNSFSGSIDVDFANLTYLERLELSTNSFFGAIPATLANCSKLRVLSLSKNNFRGQIPSGFNLLKQLTTIALSTNKLTGDLRSLVSCENLVSIVLTKNLFQESLPATLDGFGNLQVLALGYLNLSGQVPNWLQNCTKLQVLDLSWNHFEGNIPGWLGSFPHLMYLELSNNSFTGSIPLQIASLPSMMRNDTNTTGLQVVENPLVVKRRSESLGLMYSRAEALPPSLYLASNNLTGPIPEEIGQLKALVHLDLSHNMINGEIPPSVADMQSLEVLDLSYNKLVGAIPTSFTRLTFLASFDVSFNNLSGPIPIGNQFSTFPNASYQGNPNLCGTPLVKSCPSKTALNFVKSPNLRRRGMTVVLVLTSVGVSVVFLLVGGLFWILCRRNAVHQFLESSRDMNVPESMSEACSTSVELFQSNQNLTVGDLLKATNNFDPANIVGCGGFGLVYKAELGDGSRLAIKKLTGDCGQMEREFKAEVDALSKAQHRNLVSLQGYLHVGNEKLLLYSYMENGSLDYWLHERSDGGARLDWPTRLKIAQGAAAGLAYLHQICNPHIVHRDIKSSNILLDEQFEAHLADFGLARLLMATDTHVTTELVGTLGYIPPEYGEALNATTRGDVYSFGVVLLELLTGKRPVDVCKPRGCGDLVAWVHEMKKDHKLDQIYDSCLRIKPFQEQMQQLLEIACSCINRNPLKRPVIRDVVNLLNEIGQIKQSID
ncbi:hypothetical protein GOP47_0015116 [Adiantum capillus-veneris]|uniref:non-specific serine/threonine protein kinase n=1 Tax=Adiantum capillus-veneris TaxID=13818 RepID=A0A9D4UP03_ADICA|nr:hypothetical protein GOP47_0015116 [Adiantum capillus-veneris]